MDAGANHRRKKLDLARDRLKALIERLIPCVEETSGVVTDFE